jgi:transposase InsO family protein
MPRATRPTQGQNSEEQDSSSTTNDTQVSTEVLNAIMEELRSLRSEVREVQIRDQSVVEESIIVSEGGSTHTDSNSHTVIHDLYTSIPRYDGEGDIHKLLDFTDKVDDYLAVADATPAMELTIVGMKLSGIASQMWRHHKRTCDPTSPNRIRTWKELRTLFMKKKVTREQTRYMLAQLDMLKQKGSVQQYTNDFERYTMQILELPLEIEMHYYTRGLKVEIRKMVESNELNLTDMDTLKNACLRQDHISLGPPHGNDNNHKRSKSNDESIALTTSVRGKRQNRGGYTKKGKSNRQSGQHADREGDNKSDTNSNDNDQRNSHQTSRNKYKKKNLYCYACSLAGHVTKDCPAVKVVIAQTRKDKTASTSSVRTLHTSSDYTPEDGHSKLRFLIDSGTTQHMTPHRELLQDMTASSKRITTAGNHILDAVGEGNTIVMNDLQLTNVLYAPKLHDSLLSIAAVNDHGYDVTFSRNGVVAIRDGDDIIAEGYREGNLYYLQLQSQTPLTENPEMESSFESSYTLRTDTVPMSDYELWHLRLGHLGAKNLLKMPTLVQGMEHANLAPPISHVCEGCIYGKHCRTPFTESHTSRELMELVHSDLIGPIRVPSINRARYVLTFIEHRSRYPKCYFLMSKDSEVVLERFKEYKAWAENITERKIKVLRTDGGREYINMHMKAYLTGHGIEHQHTVPYTPQQNGIAERFNRTVMERTRAILHSQHLPSKLWAEVLDTIRYLYTIGPIRALKDSTPSMVFHTTPSAKPTVDHLRIIGCVAYAHINRQLRTKLDAKATKCILVGYGNECKAYRIWDPKTDRVYHSRDVTFDETQIGFKDINDGGNLVLIDDLESTDLHIDDDSEYNIEAIIQERMNNGQREYLVKWQGYEQSQNTWEPSGNLEDTQALDEWENRNEKLESTAYMTDVEPYLQTDPQNLQDALRREDRELWINAMTDEIISLQENDTWELVERPKDRKVINTRWVFHIKRRIDGSIEKRKGRFVAKGYTQLPGIDFNETYAPVVSHTAIRLIIALATQYDFTIHQMDVKSAFLHGKIDMELYIEQPEMFEERDRKAWVYKLKKGLYGLKQAGRIWNETLHDHLTQHGYMPLASEQSVYIKRDQNGHIVIIAIYVDDLQIACNDKNMLENTKVELNAHFKMTDLGEVHHILSLCIL